MNAQQQNFDELISKLEAKERADWRSSLRWTIVPVLLAFAFLGYASFKLVEANKEVSVLHERSDSLRVEAERLQIEAATSRQQTEQARATAKRLEDEVANSAERIEEMQSEISTLREQLQETLELSRFEHPVDMVDMKMFMSRYPKAGRILDKILELRNRGVGWHLGGETPEQGFDSPGFAAYVLQEFSLLPREGSESLLGASRQLAERLKTTSDPQVGDLVLYPAGYVLFRFEDRQRKPYVIGMTPSGIVALKSDFAHVVGYRKLE